MSYKGIYTKEEYLASFLKNENEQQENKTQKKQDIYKDAFKIALDTRKFEIELYWKNPH